MTTFAEICPTGDTIHSVLCEILRFAQNDWVARVTTYVLPFIPRNYSGTADLQLTNVFGNAILNLPNKTVYVRHIDNMYFYLR